MELLPILITHVVIGVVMLTLGLVVFLNNRKSATNQFFFMEVLVMVPWLIANYFALIDFAGLDIIWPRAIIFSAAFQTYILFFFAHTFPKTNVDLKTWNIWLLLLSLGGTAAISATPYVFKTLESPAAGEFVGTAVQGPLIPFFGLSVVGIVLATVILMVKKYRTANSLEKKQWGFILGGFATTFVSAVTFLFLVTNLLDTTVFIPYAPVMVVPMIVGSAIAILKYRLLNVKVITAELLTFAIWVTLLVQLLLSDTLEKFIVQGIIFIIIVFFGLLLIRNVLREVRDKEQLQKLTSELNSANTELQDLTQNLQAKVDEQTKKIRTAYEVEKKAREDLEALDKAKDQFILTTQHNLRTPLTIIKGYIQLVLSKKFGDFDERVGGYLHRIDNSTGRMAKLINELLDVSQLKVGKGIFNFETVDLKKLVSSVVKELRPEAERKKLYVKVENGNTPWPQVPLDTIKFRNAVFNVIDNGIKYTQTGGVTVKIDDSDEKIARLIIEDTGIGMDKKTTEKLFKKLFERGQEAEKLSPIGRGIGLALSYNIISAHGGTIKALSDGVNKGSKFYIEIPRTQSKKNNGSDK